MNSILTNLPNVIGFIVFAMLFLLASHLPWPQAILLGIFLFAAVIGACRCRPHPPEPPWQP